VSQSVVNMDLRQVGDCKSGGSSSCRRCRKGTHIRSLQERELLQSDAIVLLSYCPNEDNDLFISEFPIVAFCQL
jgi:hypothetical protein